MDPVSLGLGLAGVVPLLIEVATLASKAKAAISIYKKAHKELSDLAHRLDCLERICKITEDNLTKRKGLQVSVDVRIAELIVSALAQCRTKLKEINTLIGEMQGVSTLTRMRFVLQRPRIAEMARDLDSLLMMLNHSLQVDVW